MGKRKLPFGYIMKNGDVELDPTAAGCVTWIYRSYLVGSSLKAISAELNVRMPHAYDGERPWNKNMIDRILQDRRYSGDAIYPDIISCELYEAIQRQRAEQCGLPRQTDAQKIIRILGGGRVSEAVEAGVLAVLNRLIRNPDALQSPTPPELDQTKRFRTQRALDATLDQ